MLKINLDFIVLTSNGTPNRIRQIDDKCWICVIDSGEWIHLKEITHAPEVWHLQNECIDWKYHELYEFGIPFDPELWTSHDAPRKNNQLDRMLKWFAYEHLPDHLKNTSKSFSELATIINSTIEAGPERTIALRKLLESKDAAVRAKLHPGG